MPFYDGLLGFCDDDGCAFDGIDAGPEGLADVGRYTDMIAELVRRGHDDDAIRKVLGLNLLRVFRAVGNRSELADEYRTQLARMLY